MPPDSSQTIQTADGTTEMTAHTNKGFKYLVVAAIAAGAPKRARKMKSVIKKQDFVCAQVWPWAVESTRSWNSPVRSKCDFLAIAR
jgi:hypothetical protein